MIEKMALIGAPGSGKSSTIRIFEYDWQERKNDDKKRNLDQLNSTGGKKNEHKTR